MLEEALNLLPEELKKPIKLLQELRGLPWSQLWLTVFCCNRSTVEEILTPRASELWSKIHGCRSHHNQQV
ncbi:hypothetical protein PanWU01x14_121820 [Parasponia andersonii]|uniref:Uncharacterized protein n=1 Tax=Parasponia andersonii TaxID=3476 RepID=A0A2P5CUG7_PARAD|nr:hypothetical protein PanWU01x14_121820 [Parasponia andersonii]